MMNSKSSFLLVIKSFYDVQYFNFDCWKDVKKFISKLSDLTLVDIYIKKEDASDD